MSSPATSAAPRSSVGRNARCAACRRCRGSARRPRGTAAASSSETCRSKRERQVDDGVLQPLAHPDGHDLHRRGVAVEPAGALGRAAGAACAPRAASRAARAARAARGARSRAAAGRGGRGRSAAARRRARPAPAAAIPATCAASSTAATPRARSEVGPARAASRPIRSVSASPPACEAGRGLADEHRGRRGPHQAGAVRLLERLEQAQPVVGGLRGEDVGVAGVDRRDAGRGQRVADRPARRLCASTITATSPARTGRPSYVAPEASSRADVGGEVARRCGRAASSIGTVLRCRPTPNVSRRDDPQPERVRRTGRRPAGCPGGGPSTVADHDVRVPERGAAEHRLERVDQRLRRCASWCRACAAVPAVLGGRAGR